MSPIFFFSACKLKVQMGAFLFVFCAQNLECTKVHLDLGTRRRPARLDIVLLRPAYLAHSVNNCKTHWRWWHTFCYHFLKGRESCGCLSLLPKTVSWSCSWPAETRNCMVWMKKAVLNHRNRTASYWPKLQDGPQLHRGKYRRGSICLTGRNEGKQNQVVKKHTNIKNTKYDASLTAAGKTQPAKRFSIMFACAWVWHRSVTVTLAQLSVTLAQLLRSEFYKIKKMHANHGASTILW